MIITPVMICGAAFLILGAFAVGALLAMSDCADAAVSNNPPIWWLRSVEFAKGRKNANAIKESTHD